MDNSIGRKSVKKASNNLYVLDEDFYPGKFQENFPSFSNSNQILNCA